MFPDFSNIDFLRTGSPIQQKGWKILHQTQLLKKLQPYTPVLTGTLPIDIFVEGKSDIDISCEVFSFSTFTEFVNQQFAQFKNITIKEKELSSIPSIIVTFDLPGFPVEIVGQPISINEQVAVRHLQIEHVLLNHYGNSFRQRIIDLKSSGLKTEPAFAYVLNLNGDPYAALLNLNPDLYNQPPHKCA